MRFKGKTKSSKDQDVEVFNFSLGLHELYLLHSVVKKTLSCMPGAESNFTLQPFISRLRNMSREIERALRTEDVDVKKAKDDIRKKVNEVEEAMIRGQYHKKDYLV